MSFFCKLTFPVLMYVAGTSHSLPTESLQPQQLPCWCAAGHSCCSNSSLVLWQFVISATASGTYYTRVITMYKPTCTHTYRVCWLAPASSPTAPFLLWLESTPCRWTDRVTFWPMRHKQIWGVAERSGHLHSFLLLI